MTSNQPSSIKPDSKVGHLDVLSPYMQANSLPNSNNVDKNSLSQVNLQNGKPLNKGNQSAQVDGVKGPVQPNIVAGQSPEVIALL